MKTKICKKCAKRKTLNEFPKGKRYKWGVKSTCKICYRKWKKGWEDKNRIKVRSYSKKSQMKYHDIIKEGGWRKLGIIGMSWQLYLKMVEFQEGKCYICGKYFGRELCVDHNHQTGKIRKLVCKGCNIKIGCCENYLIHYKIENYLREHDINE